MRTAYRFEVWTPSSLISPSLSAENRVSAGADEKLYGPDYIIRSPSRLTTVLVLSEQWYFALSQRYTVSSYHPGVS